MSERGCSRPRAWTRAWSTLFGRACSNRLSPGLLGHGIWVSTISPRVSTIAGEFRGRGMWVSTIARLRPRDVGFHDCVHDCGNSATLHCQPDPFPPPSHDPRTRSQRRPPEANSYQTEKNFTFLARSNSLIMRSAPNRIRTYNLLIRSWFVLRVLVCADMMRYALQKTAHLQCNQRLLNLLPFAMNRKVPT